MKHAVNLLGNWFHVFSKVVRWKIIHYLAFLTLYHLRMTKWVEMCSGVLNKILGTQVVFAGHKKVKCNFTDSII
jgi:hypothetical protein